MGAKRELIFHTRDRNLVQKQIFLNNFVQDCGFRLLPCHYIMKEGEQGPFSPKLRVRIKHNNSSPRGKFCRFLLPFSSKFSDLNFASYVLYILIGTLRSTTATSTKTSPQNRTLLYCKSFAIITGLLNPVGICVAFRRFVFFRVGKSLACHSPA